jgi:hypothetical protein
MRPEVHRPRVLLLRTGRHLQVALGALGRHFPGCEVAVVGTPGSEAAIAQAGVPGGLTFVYDARPTFDPWAFGLSRAARAARRWGFDHVAVLWNDPSGVGQGNVDRTAFSLAPRGFWAVTPDGGLIERRLWPQLRRELMRGLASLAVGSVLALVFIPAYLAGRGPQPASGTGDGPR